MTTSVLSTDRVWVTAWRIVWGRLLSTTATSLENRLTMRPEGVVSKKLMGARMMLVSMEACRMPAAFTIRVVASREYDSTMMAGGGGDKQHNNNGYFL